MTTALARTPSNEVVAHRVTKSLLGYGVIAGPLYLVTSLTQAATREGFDLTRHAWSQLALGGPGWIQVTNFVVTGSMLVAFAIGLRRALVGGPGARWIPRLIAIFGVSMVVAGVFKVGPGRGFPTGAPEVGIVTTSGLVHLAAAGVGFLCLAADLLVWRSRLSHNGFAGLALGSAIIGPAFLVAFIGMASGLLGDAGIPVFVVAVVVVMLWLATLAVHQYRQLPRTDAGC